MTNIASPRTQIDQFLTDAGWVLQDRHELDRHAGLGVAEREFSPYDGFCDYRLFVGGKAAGVIEAKRAGVADQAVAVSSGPRMSFRGAQPMSRYAEVVVLVEQHREPMYERATWIHQ